MSKCQKNPAVLITLIVIISLITISPLHAVPAAKKTPSDPNQVTVVEKMVNDVGDMLTASNTGGGMAFDISNPAWLCLSCKNNPRVKMIIEEGRKSPEIVGSIVSKDLLRRMASWIDTAWAYHKSPDGGGFVIAHDGTRHGDNNFQKYLEDTYAIEAGMFILMNIEYSKALDVLAEYCNWYIVEVKVDLPVKRPDGTVEIIAFSNVPNAPDKKKLNDDFLFTAISHLLLKSKDKNYSKAKESLIKYFKGQPPTIERPAGRTFGSKQKMKMYFQNEAYIAKEFDRYRSYKFGLIYDMAQVHKNKTTKKKVSAVPQTWERPQADKSQQKQPAGDN